MHLQKGLNKGTALCVGSQMERSDTNLGFGELQTFNIMSLIQSVENEHILMAD